MSIYGPSSGTVSKPIVITILAEESGILKKGFYEWSFGNGASTKKSGYTMMRAGKIPSMSLTSPQVMNGAAVNISINGYEKKNYGITVPRGKQSGVIHFNPPCLVNEGSVINCVTASTSHDAAASVVALLIELFI